MSRYKLVTAAVVTVIYISLAAGFVREDRRTHSGGFINLQGMMSALVTLPVAFPLEYWGHKLDFRSNWQVAAAIVVCGALVFALAVGVLSFAEFLRAAAPASR